MNWIVLAVPAAFLVAFAASILVEMVCSMLAYRSRWRELTDLWNWFSRHQAELDRLLEFGRRMRGPTPVAAPNCSPVATPRQGHADDTVPYTRARSEDKDHAPVIAWRTVPK